VNNPNIKHLDISIFGKLDDDCGMSRLLQPCLALTNLNVEFMPNSSVAMCDVMLIVSRCINLETLKMAIPLLSHHSRDQRTHFAKAGTVSSVEYKKLNNTKDILVKGNKLCCLQMTEFFNNIRDFSTIIVFGTMIVTDCLLQKIAENNPSLVNLFLHFCGDVYSPDALKKLVCVCKYMTKIHLLGRCSEDRLALFKSVFMSLHIHEFESINMADNSERTEGEGKLYLSMESVTSLLLHKFVMFR
jgi:hypothetical protein